MKKLVIAALALAVVVAGCKKETKKDAAKGTNDTAQVTNQAEKAK